MAQSTAGDYLLFLDQMADGRGEVFRVPGRRQVYVTDPRLAKDVLRNEDGAFREHSDFFYSRSHTFGPRSAQIEIGRDSRLLLRDHFAAVAAELPARVTVAVAPGAKWPDAANWLLYRHIAGALLGPGTPPELPQLVERIVARGVLAGAPERHSAFSRAVFRRQVMRQLSAEVTRRRSHHGQAPVDVLDVIVARASDDTPPRALAEVFLSFVFATAGATGFLLAWSVYLLAGEQKPADTPPAWVVREALRLWPVAWMFGRRPTRAQSLGDVEFGAADEVVVCPYLVHRNPRHWAEPDRFQPERWAGATSPDAFIPFGWGPHTCAGAGLATQLVEDIVEILNEMGRLEVTVAHGDRPQIGPSLAPPRFSVRVVAR
jgi:cytochrome P450